MTDTEIIAYVEAYFETYPMLVCDTKHLVNRLVPTIAKCSYEQRNEIFAALNRLARKELSSYARKAVPRPKRLSRGAGKLKMIRPWAWARYGETNPA